MRFIVFSVVVALAFWMPIVMSAAGGALMTTVLLLPANGKSDDLRNIA